MFLQETERHRPRRHTPKLPNHAPDEKAYGDLLFAVQIILSVISGGSEFLTLLTTSRG